jgi:hypothetical protein
MGFLSPIRMLAHRHDRMLRVGAGSIAMTRRILVDGKEPASQRTSFDAKGGLHVLRGRS